MISSRKAGPRSASATSLAVVLAAAVVVLPAHGSSAAEAQAAIPPNDSFSNAAVLYGSEGSELSSNVGASKEAGEPAHANNTGGRSVWYRWTPPATGRATLSTAGSSFNTLLAVYTGDNVGSLSAVTSSNDAFGAAGVHSSVGFTATAGVEYRIAVDGAAGLDSVSETGTVTLRWVGATPPAAINVTRPNGAEKVQPGTNLPITYAYESPAPPATHRSTSTPASIESDLHWAAVAAAREGSVQSIVRMAVSFTPEGNLDHPQAGAQRQGIADKRRALLGRLKGSDHTVVRTYDSLPLVTLRLSAAAVDRLRGAPELASITEDGLSAPTLARSTALVEGPSAHAAGFDGTGQMVAVLDTGTDKAHPYLAGKVIEEACYSSTSDCPNGQTSQIGAGAGVPCTYAPGECAHGTADSGIVAGSDAASSGVGRGASLMAVQVFGRFTGSSCGAGEDPCARSRFSDQIAALERVYALRTTHTFAAVNISIGSGSFSGGCDRHPMKLAIDNLRAVGIPTIISSGNDGHTSSMTFPACISTAISVGATTQSDSIGSFSNSSRSLSLLAPGVSIVSPVPGGGFAAWSGTSMAAPHVAGAWAVIKQFKPTASVTEVLSALQKTGWPVPDGRNGITKPRIRVQRAMVALDPRVRIDLLRGAVVVTNIVDNLPVPAGGRGTYVWAVPTGQATASDYTVRVTLVPDPRATDGSNAAFSITSHRPPPKAVA